MYKIRNNSDSLKYLNRDIKGRENTLAAYAHSSLYFLYPKI